ncbi:agmatine coumaroyltransferase-2-like [Macadamia integrifolia]|uniref:agmatine coumaroyltransferase-2-like n=1 Tax=Macadamia integrifolia TaxID=60698 RepID=UPI001C531849|nr:agmatine coumaroyltransferase-2-like [Macadamia integrifolia]
MKIKRESSRIVKPIYEGDHPPTTLHIPLTVFDKATYNAHVAIIYGYRPPTPPNAAIERGLRKVLSEYREWAGRLGVADEKGRRRPVILLNDGGIKFVEASVDCTLDQAIMPFKPSPMLLNFHPSLKGVEELVQVQLTRFTCGSLVIGFTAHHLVADGHSTSNFLVAWSQVCRGIDMNPCPFHNRSIFAPRELPILEFEHRGVEFTSKKLSKVFPLFEQSQVITEDIVVHKVHFTLEFLANLKARASSSHGTNKLYSTFESLAAHLWRTITTARGLNGFEITQVRISVNGRGRLNLNPCVPNEYFGNLVLWAFPSAKVEDLLSEPLPFATKIIHDSIAKVNGNYFKSFIDFASYKVDEEGLVPTADMNKSVLCPNLEVDSWLRFPFYDLDLGGGSPFMFMPSFFPTEGMMFLLPSFIRDGSIDAFIPLFQQNLVAFKQICYSLD